MTGAGCDSCDWRVVHPVSESVGPCHTVRGTSMDSCGRDSTFCWTLVEWRPGKIMIRVPGGNVRALARCRRSVPLLGQGHDRRDRQKWAAPKLMFMVQELGMASRHCTKLRASRTRLRNRRALFLDAFPFLQNRPTRPRWRGQDSVRGAWTNREKPGTTSDKGPGRSRCRAHFSPAVREQPRHCLRAARRFPERIPATPTKSSRNQEAPIRGSA